MNLFAHFTGIIKKILGDMAASGDLPDGLDTSRVVVEPPRDASHGDITTNAAMVLARQAKTNPRAIAQKLAARLEACPDIEKLDIAGPGFVNMTLKGEFWAKVLHSALAGADKFGRSDAGAGRRVNVEYVSANPTGPLHVGHCRGAVFGDALANLLEQTGHEVTREYYMNDAGSQIDVLAKSAFLRYREALGEDIGEIPAGLYPGSYLVPVGKALAKEFGDTLKGMAESEWLQLVRPRAISMMMDLIRDDLASLGIRQEVFFSEKKLHEEGGIERAVAALEEKGLVYEGRLPPPKGQLPDDWEDREQTLFRSTEFGDDVDRALKKSNGDYTYFAADVAYAKDKIDRGFDELIFVLGADHGGYVKRLQAVTKAFSDGKVNAVVRLCQLVNLLRAGQPVKMSKRAGDFVTLRDIVDEVGPDVVRFMMLYRKNDAPLDFDFHKVSEQSKDNPVFYVQYAHARICSVFRNAKDELGKLPDLAALTARDLEILSDPAEMMVVRRLAEYPRMIESAAHAHEPHRVAFYLYELASDFHSLWNKGKDKPNLRFIIKNSLELSHARLALLAAVRYILADGLRILGVKPVEEM